MTAFTTADLCDGHQGQVQVCATQFRSFGLKRAFCGEIATVRTYQDAGLVRQVVQTSGNGRILVIDNGLSTQAAVFGDRLAALAVRNGWEGVVVFGAIRDTEALSTIDLGIVATAVTPRRGTLNGAGQIGITIEQDGAIFRPGAFLYCDADGVIVSNTPLAA
ncbi:ribonuclease E activity regulator RraA [Paracoccus sp. S3-43]|uniref:ribonuclease E activity regulator RraA n=1 Tax=Paracoccus sp. S3-43 TaxID=3030011 RepID=UPI0023AFD098|nr:ribonuclease E activity regulator RraA [Paracoccus sp. S3-43]WEF24688.1 ribonuclease E activity regulator RraA [Paracoccus sp. S3-43]